MQRSSSTSPKRPELFSPDDGNVKHTRIGAWDFYEQIPPSKKVYNVRIPLTDKVESARVVFRKLPYIWRMLKDVANVQGVSTLMLVYVLVSVVMSLLPAVSLWYSGQILKIVEMAVEERTVDARFAVQVVGGRIFSEIAFKILEHTGEQIKAQIDSKANEYYSAHIFKATAMLDVPTYDEPTVKSRMSSVNNPRRGPAGIAMDCVGTVMGCMNSLLQLGSQLLVLLSVLKNQRDGVLLACICIFESVYALVLRLSGHIVYFGTWAANTTDPDYIRFEGLKLTVNRPQHRNEIVAGNMWKHLISEYHKTLNMMGGHLHGFFQAQWDFNSLNKGLSLPSLFYYPLRELPQIVFAIRAIQYPASVPVSLASLNLIKTATASFGELILHIWFHSASIGEELQSLINLYEIMNIPNIIADGSKPFPENTQTLAAGVAIEFRNVSFKYPGSDSYALKNVSFKILPGQLCVLIGTNGSGKSTVLKLITRIYDTLEGQIFMDDQDIKTLRLFDLRNTISVLFQDFSHFPLSIKLNIGLGNPDNAHDEDMIRQAAQLGGADKFIEKLPEGFDTYLERPVEEHHGNLPEGTSSLFGRSLDGSKSSTSLSGGQLQRLALSRTFMRTLSEPGVGLLLFDEPSASLDPAAEHDLFERLRDLRGQRTMIFSSHRFGNLTRHADLILYMNDSEVLESGTHDELIKANGEYGKVWALQAQAFL